MHTMTSSTTGILGKCSMCGSMLRGSGAGYCWKKSSGQCTGNGLQLSIRGEGMEAEHQPAPDDTRNQKQVRWQTTPRNEDLKARASTFDADHCSGPNIKQTLADHITTLQAQNKALTFENKSLIDNVNELLAELHRRDSV